MNDIWILFLVLIILWMIKSVIFGKKRNQVYHDYEMTWLHCLQEIWFIIKMRFKKEKKDEKDN